MSEFPDTTGKTIAKMTIETINEPGLWGEIFDRLTVLFTDGSKVTFRSMFCSTQHSKIIKDAWEHILDIEMIDAEDKEPSDDLVASIKQHGILQPIVVEAVEGGRYKLKIGRKRMTAARMIGLEKVPALVLDDQDCAESKPAARAEVRT